MLHRLLLGLFGPALLCPALLPGQGRPGPPIAQPLANPAQLNVPWQPLAPVSLSNPATGYTSGRVLSVAVDPADTSGNTVYLGTTGGVWKSSNAQALTSSVTFQPLTDSLPAVSRQQLTVTSIGAVTVQPGGTGVVLAGTGDPTNISDAIYGTGLLRSTDSGVTWSVITDARSAFTGLSQASFFGEAFSAFAWGTASRDFVVAGLSPAVGAAAVNAGYVNNSTAGLYYSQDAGQSWQMATITDGPGQVLQQAGQQGGGVPVLAVVWNPVRQIFVAALRFHGFYSSPNGVTWTRLAQQPGTALSHLSCPFVQGGGGSANCPIYNAGLAVQSATGDMFAVAVNQAEQDSGIWQDVCAANRGSCLSPLPTFSQPLPVTTLESTSGTPYGTIAGASRALWLAAVPSGSDTLLLAGATDIFRCSLAGGCTWRNTTNASGCAAARVGPAQHSVAWDPGTSTLFFGNDRGLWRSTNQVSQAGASCSFTDVAAFDNLNLGLGPLAEITSLAQDPSDATELMAGLGRQGTAGGGSGTWQAVFSSDGGSVGEGWGATAGSWFATSGPGVSISQCTSGSSCGPGLFGTTPVIGNAQVGGDGAALSRPAIWSLDPQDPTRILVGTCRVWRGLASGRAWSAANALSTPLDGVIETTCTSSDTPIQVLAASGTIPGQGTPNAERLYAGMAGLPAGYTHRPGHLLSAVVTPSSAGGSTPWSDLSGSPVVNDPNDRQIFNPGHMTVSSVVLDPTDLSGKTVYVGIAGFGGSGFAEIANAPLVYGSTDGGQHWTNLTSNLPNVPVNALAIDPSDPVIMYAATDGGVYVTASVTQCPTQACWSPYGVNLPPVRITTLSTVTSNGLALLRAGTQGRGIWETQLASTAVQAVAATASLTPGSLTFGSQALGTVSGSQTLTIQNTGTVDLTLGTVSVTNIDFVPSSQCPATLAAGASCTIGVVFAPTATGTRSANLSVPANTASGSLTASLTGTGANGASIVLTPPRMDFGSLVIGQTSAVQYLTIANLGTSPATLQSEVISGPFAITANTCGATLAVNTSCTIGIRFTPTAAGAASGTLVASDTAGTQTAFLSGTGQAAATDILTPLSLTFAAQTEGTVSPAQQVTLTNNGDQALSGVVAATTAGFLVTNRCGGSVPAHSTCSLLVTFAPQSAGAQSGTLTVQDALQTQTVTLNGTGTVPVGSGGPSLTASPLNVNFGAEGIATSSAAQQVSIINNGSVTLTGVTVVASTGYQVATNGCGGTLGPGASCLVGVAFAPQSVGPLGGTLNVSAHELSNPLLVTLTGSGLDFELTVQGASTSIVTGGTTATYQLALTPLGGSAGVVQLACTGAPEGSTCSFNPGSVTLSGTGASATVQVSVTTKATTAASTQPHSLPGRPVAGVLALAALFLWRGRRLRLAAAAWARYGALLIVGGVCLGLSGCGLSINGGRAAATPGGGATQGVYTLTVGGTAPGVTHSVTLSLTVE